MLLSEIIHSSINRTRQVLTLLVSRHTKLAKRSGTAMSPSAEDRRPERISNAARVRE